MFGQFDYSYLWFHYCTGKETLYLISLRHLFWSKAVANLEFPSIISTMGFESGSEIDQRRIRPTWKNRIHIRSLKYSGSDHKDLQEIFHYWSIFWIWIPWSRSGFQIISESLAIIRKHIAAKAELRGKTWGCGYIWSCIRLSLRVGCISQKYCLIFLVHSFFGTKNALEYF